MISQFKGLLSDGGWGTEFQHKGAEPGECFEHWNLTQPDKVSEVAVSYVEAGSNIILTNTFGGNGLILRRHHLEDQLYDINRAAAQICRDAAGDRAYVFGSVGPCGKLVSMDEVDADELYDAFSGQVKALEDGGVDAIVIETMIDLGELKIAMQAIGDNTDLPFGACMTFDSGPERMNSMMGSSIEDAVDAIRLGGGCFVGANCGTGLYEYKKVAKRLCQKSEMPVWIKPNAGIPDMIQGKIVYNQNAEQFAEEVSLFFEMGVAIFGGCCGSSPAFIRAMADAVKK
ncbi:MAG: homocysteine S-methyltransferase family protein [SAR324 cluster bacterium]|nr:homocysteine S-methyltransferase family protein [SAR324 cluster bacterium]